MARDIGTAAARATNTADLDAQSSSVDASALSAQGASAIDRIVGAPAQTSDAAPQAAADKGPAPDTSAASAQLDAINSQFGDNGTKLLMELSQSIVTDGPTSPATVKKLWELLRSEPGSLAEKWIPGAEGVMEIKHALTGTDKAGHKLSAGQRIVEGLKGLFGIFVAVNTFGLSSGVALAAHTASRVANVESSIEQAARLMPALARFANDKDQAALIASIVAIASKQSLVERVVNGAEKLIVDAVDGKHDDAVAPTQPAAAPATQP